MNVFLQILVALMPQAPVLIEDVVAMVKALEGKYPAMTPEQIRAAVVAVSQQADLSFLTELAKIAADQGTAIPTA